MRRQAPIEKAAAVRRHSVPQVPYGVAPVTYRAPAAPNRQLSRRLQQSVHYVQQQERRSLQECRSYRPVL
jgi:hypothetical protein